MMEEVKDLKVLLIIHYEEKVDFAVEICI